MKTGLLERVMTRRYGRPTMGIRHGLPAKCWNLHDPDHAAAFYVGMKWNSAAGAQYTPLKEIYGDVFGGFLIKNILKVAVLLPREVYGLWNIEELRDLPQVRHALVRDPAVDYFMDAANVWYYGHRRGDLYVYDTATDELDSLGPIEQALEELLEDWEAARQANKDR